MITLQTLNHWLTAPTETEHLEFKEARQQYDSTKLLRYCVALANEGGYFGSNSAIVGLERLIKFGSNCATFVKI